MTDNSKDFSSFSVVDAHAHIFKQDMPLNDNPRHAPVYDFTLEDYLAQLDAHHVTYGVIAAASPWSDYNDYIIASVKNNPRLRGTVIVKPEVEKYILEFMNDDGIVGVRLPFIGLKQKPDLDSFEYRRLLTRIADLDWHVHLHVESSYLAEILPKLERCGVKTVVDHLGRFTSLGPDKEADFAALVAAVKRGRTWVKASGAYRIGDSAKEVLHRLMTETGTERLMWASDCPFVGEESLVNYQQTINYFYDLLPDKNDRKKIFSSNAIAFYGFDDE